MKAILRLTEKRRIRNTILYYKHRGGGYTEKIKQAHQYELEEAEKIATADNEYDDGSNLVEVLIKNPKPKQTHE